MSINSSECIVLPLHRGGVLFASVSFEITAFFYPFVRYFQAGGSPENVIQLLSENYTAVAQTVNLLAEWLIQTGMLQWPNIVLWL